MPSAKSNEKVELWGFKEDNKDSFFEKLNLMDARDDLSCK